LLNAVNLRDLLANAVQGIFETMLSTKTQILESDALLPKEGQRIVGSVGFAGKASGAVYLDFGEEWARLITATMLRMKCEEIIDVDHIYDTIGELSNMVGGNIKSQLCDSGLPCLLTIPSVTRGSDFHVAQVVGVRHEYFLFGCLQYRAQAGVVIKIDE
jgi:chemotaxis protein CheX